MTEAEWRACDDPARMLRAVRLRATPRKLRLFAAACCRLVWDRLPGDHVRQAVETAERYADYLLGDDERESARRALNRAVASERGLRGRLAQAAAELLRPGFSPTLVSARARTGRPAALLSRRQCELLRDLFGGPGCRPAADPAGLSQNPGEVRRLAEAIYDGRDFGRLPVLADALEAAGCADRPLLAHCRSGGEHARGCWALDAVLGKE
jgi:hypothetical protein